MNRKLIPVEGHDGLYRDDTSGMIVKKNPDEYESYMKAYNLRQKQKTTLNSLQNDVDVLKSNMSEIKDLLTELIRRE